MIRRNGSPQHGQLLLIDRLDTIGTARALDRVALSPTTGGEDDLAYGEGWLQALIHRFPQTLPIAEIEPGLAGAAAVCMELPTPAGYVDNLFATARGDLVLTECKLWRNPEARREVVAQTIDYAASMASWSYRDLEEAVARGSVLGGERPSGSLYELAGGEQETEEHEFIDAVARNLRLGRMLLLIVGDGIREGVETLADYLQGHAGFHFTLGLVELPVHRMPGAGGYLVHPRVLARTVNIERAIVRIEDGRPVAAPLPATARSSGGGRPTSITEEHLFEALAERDATLPARLRSFLERAAVHGVTYHLGRSLMLKWRDHKGNTFNLGCIYPNGDVRTDPVNWTADYVGKLDLAHEYLQQLAASVEGTVRRTPKPATWYVTTDGSKVPSIGALLAVTDQWLAAIEHYTTALEQGAQTNEDAAGE